MSGGVEGFALAYALLACGAGNRDTEVKAKYFDAAHNAAEAGYVDSGLKDQVDTSLRYIEQRYVNKEVLKYGSVTVRIGQVLVEKRLTIKFEF